MVGVVHCSRLPSQCRRRAAVLMQRRLCGEPDVVGGRMDWHVRLYVVKETGCNCTYLPCRSESREGGR